VPDLTRLHGRGTRCTRPGLGTLDTVGMTETPPSAGHRARVGDISIYYEVLERERPSS